MAKRKNKLRTLDDVKTAVRDKTLIVEELTRKDNNPGTSVDLGNGLQESQKTVRFFVIGTPDRKFRTQIDYENLSDATIDAAVAACERTVKSGNLEKASDK